MNDCFKTLEDIAEENYQNSLKVAERELTAVQDKYLALAGSSERIMQRR